MWKGINKKRKSRNQWNKQYTIEKNQESQKMVLWNINQIDKP